jgi:hypothetical protein
MRGISSQSNSGFSREAGEPLRLEHRAAIEPLLEQLRYGLSEYCFANLYLFREIHQYRLVDVPFPFLLGVTYDGERHAMPLLPLEPPHMETLFDHASCIYPMPKDVIGSMTLSSLDVSWNDADSDYVYDATRLSRLTGAKLRSKRAQAERFRGSAHPVLLPLSAENTPRAQDVLDTWMRQLPPGRANVDYNACARALRHFNDLSLEGILITDGGSKNYAFLIASRLSDGTLAVHFAKGDRDFEGVYPFMFSQLGVGTARGYLNFEQDLGLPGLRQAKRALAPAARLRKYRLRRRAAAEEK